MSANTCRIPPPGALPFLKNLRDNFAASIPLPGKDATSEVISLLLMMEGELSRREIMQLLGLSDENHFRGKYQQAVIKAGCIELTIPAKPILTARD